MAVPINTSISHSVSDAIHTRRSARAFLANPVQKEDIEDILHVASRAPSGTNMQPWKTYVLQGNTLDTVVEASCKAFDEGAVGLTSEMDYYPKRWFEPYLSRRRKVGWSLYSLLGIVKGDREGTKRQHRRNYVFFDAPVGLLFTVHRELATGSWLDYGMYMQNIMLLAREKGLHTCPQAAWADYHQILRNHLPIADEEIVVCGMALGYADGEAIENSLTTERVPLAEHVVFFQ